MFRLFAFVLSLVLSPCLASAQVIGDADAVPIESTNTLPEGLFVSPAISTLGLGVEGGMRMTETFGFRLGGNWFGFDEDGVEDGVSYDAEATLASIGALVDYHPFRGGFRISGGLRFNFNQADVTGTADDDVTIGNETFTADEIGTLKGDVSYDPVAPYFGIGYGATLLQGSFSIGFDLGVMYQGDADVELESENGLLSNSAELNENLAIEEQEIEDDLEVLNFYPVVGLMATYRF